VPDLGNGLRPQIETFEHAGCQVAVVDLAQILAAAAIGPVELLHDPPLPATVRRVTCSIRSATGDGPAGFQFDAMIWIGTRPERKPRSELVGLGNDPVGVLLTRRSAAGDEWAGRLADRVGTVAAEVTRLLGLGRPAPLPRGPLSGRVLRRGERVDPGTGLTASVTHREPPAAPEPGPAAPAEGVVITVRVVDPVVSAERLAAMFGLVLAVLRDEVGAAALAGRGFVLTRHRRAGGTDRVSDVTLDQVGGLDEVVTQFRQIAVSFRHPQVMARWGARRPQGILLYGPPGTGKTMLARALANEIGANFREIRTPEILDKWLGASERNIKRIFREARRYRDPTVMLFDEFDSIISYAGAGGDAASQAVNAVAGIFKQEMNNLIEDNPNVIVMATTNFPHRVDDSLIRSGRFDIKLAIPAPDEAGRASIVTKMIRQLIAAHEAPGFQMFAADLDPTQLAVASAGMTGADLREALRRVRLAKAMHEANTGDPAPPISQQDLIGYLEQLRRATT